MQIQCLHCGIFTNKFKSDIRKRSFCSNSCYLADKAKCIINKSCGYCGTQVKKRPSDIRKNKTSNVFCSRNCANRYQGIKKKKEDKAKKWFCQKCKKETKRQRKFCKECVSVENKTINQVCGHIKNSALKYAGIRCHARSKTKKREQKCTICNYSKHVECCHIRDITDFPETSLLSEVNADSNLILLCPNCHWEFDHDLLAL